MKKTSFLLAVLIISSLSFIGCKNDDSFSLSNTIWKSTMYNGSITLKFIDTKNFSLSTLGGGEPKGEGTYTYAHPTITLTIADSYELAKATVIDKTTISLQVSNELSVQFKKQ